MEPSQVYRRDILEIEAVMPEFEAAHEEGKEDDEKPSVHSKHFVFPEGWFQLALFCWVLDFDLPKICYLLCTPQRALENHADLGCYVCR